MRPIDPNDESVLDELLSRARWPEPSAASTRRLQATWAGVSPAGRSRRAWRVVAAAVAVIAMSTGLAALLISREPADPARRQRTQIVIPPQVAPAQVASTRQTAVRDFVHFAPITDADMIPSHKLAIWSEVRRQVRTGRGPRTVAATLAARTVAGQTSRPSATKAPPAPDVRIDAGAKLMALRVQLART